MASRRGRGRTTKAAVAAAVATVVGAGAAWVAQHRAVSRAAGEAARGHDDEGLELPADLVHHDIVTDDGARIHVVERGSGPAVLLLHGMLLSSELWVHQLTDLAEHHRVVAVDLRGHGRSAPGIRGITIDRMAGDVRCVIDALKLHGCLLVGHSMGGMVALRMLDQTPPDQRGTWVGALALVSTTAGPMAGGAVTGPLARAGGRALSIVAHGAERIEPRGPLTDDLRWWITRTAFGPEPVAAQVNFARQLHGDTPKGTLGEALAALASFNEWELLPNLDMPALIVVGTRDRLTPVAHARRMAALLPNAQMVELPRCGHMPMLERRHEFSHLLEEFAAKLG